MKYLFNNIFGFFVFDNKFNLIEKSDSIKDLKKRYSNLSEVPKEKINIVLAFFKDTRYFNQFYSQNIKITKQKIKDSVSPDVLIIQTISNFEELTKTSNLLTKRLREWYSWYFPELNEEINDHETFVDLVVNKNKKELMKELKIKESMGADLSKIDLDEMVLLGKNILELSQLKKKHEIYLGNLMKSHCPNLMELAGVTIGAKLIELGKGLKHLALLPSSTIQLLGAEKALFRHLKTNSRCPKHGIILNHSLLQNAKKMNKGKMARMLADKLSLCARLDYFKGEFKAKEYRKILEEKFL